MDDSWIAFKGTLERLLEKVEKGEMIPHLLCLRSCLPGAKEILERELKELNLNPKVVYNADVYQSKLSLGEVKPEVVFGSNIERHAVEKMGYSICISDLTCPRR